MINHPNVTFIKLDRQSFPFGCSCSMSNELYTRESVLCLFSLMRYSLKPSRHLVYVMNTKQTVANARNFIRTNVKINYDLWYKL